MIRKKYTVHGIDILYGKLMDSQFVYETINNFNDENNTQYNEMKNFIKYTTDRKVLLDVGASYGIFSFMFCNDRSKKAYAFDGSIATHMPARQTIDINQYNIHLFRTLVGSTNAIVQSMQTNEQVSLGAGGTTDIMLRLDSFCNEFEVSPDAIKIDVEGYEYHVLLGAEEVIALHRPTIFMEIHPKYLAHHNSSIYDLYAFSKKHNYRVIGPDDVIIENFEKYLETLLAGETLADRTVWLPN